MQRLLSIAGALGLFVEFRPLRRAAGYYLHQHGLIVLNSRTSDMLQRIVLAHELGHAHHGHDWSGAHNRARDELEADTYAARLLITPEAYRDAEMCVGPNPAAVAKELGVTRRLVVLRQSDFARDETILRTVEEWREEWVS